MTFNTTYHYPEKRPISKITWIVSKKGRFERILSFNLITARTNEHFVRKSREIPGINELLIRKQPVISNDWQRPKGMVRIIN
jgi:hypothetical protein